MTNNHTIVIAHTGVAELPENTMSGFQRAIAVGADMIEIDMRASKDGEGVIIHDETLYRTTNGTGVVSDFTMAELRQLDAGNGEKIPTFDEVIALHVPLNIEVKVPGLEEKIVAALKNRPDDVISSFNFDILNRIHALDTSVKIGYLYLGQDWREIVRMAQRARAYSLHPHNTSITPELVQACHDANLKVLMWSTDDPKRARQLIDWGVDGIMCHDVENMAKFVRSQQR